MTAVKCVRRSALPIRCCKTYHLATMNSVTDRWTDHIIMPIADHAVCSTIG